MALRETGWDGMDCIHLAQERNQWKSLVNTVVNLWVPYNVEKFFSNSMPGGFSRRAQLHVVNLSILKQRVREPIPHTSTVY
jgi:hypothetical protein